MLCSLDNIHHWQTTMCVYLIYFLFYYLFDYVEVLRNDTTLCQHLILWIAATGTEETGCRLGDPRLPHVAENLDWNKHYFKVPKCLYKRHGLVRLNNIWCFKWIVLFCMRFVEMWWWRKLETACIVSLYLFIHVLFLQHKRQFLQ